MSDETLGYCGLYCGACKAFQATKAGNPLVDEASGASLICDGCNGSRLTPWCASCAIKDCAREKGVRICGECPENPCDKLNGFMNDPKYPYHRVVQEDMSFLKTQGLEAFERRITERYTCSSCGTLMSWFAKACPGCGKAVSERS
ncbi:MAG TPA: DUF3795 domain-containing protein [Treponemataceae bacterium]|nr:DUF3795 domain-containing protein [Treponemataceae bacterium]HPS43827.1 DUF3795 domain-containing protein [Treponemataceae bacterium]